MGLHGGTGMVIINAACSDSTNLGCGTVSAEFYVFLVQIALLYIFCVTLEPYAYRAHTPVAMVCALLLRRDIPYARTLTTLRCDRRAGATENLRSGLHVLTSNENKSTLSMHIRKTRRGD